MKRLILAALLAAAPLPLLAGGISFDLPRLSFPEPAPVETTQGCQTPTQITAACPEN